MSDDTPTLRELEQLAERMESQAGIFPDESQPERVAEWCAAELRGVISGYKDVSQGGANE